MNSRKLSWKQKAKIVWMALFHRNTPFSAKATIAGGLLYGILPIDLIPDLLPILGIADDATVLVVAILVFLYLTKTVRKEMEIRENFIDVEPL